MDSTEIANMALSFIGAASITNLLTDTTLEAVECNRFYETARDMVLESGNISVLEKREAGAVIGGGYDPAVLTQWEYAYAMPSDCLLFRGIAVDGADTSDLRPKYQLQLDDSNSSTYILTNEEAAILVYTATTTSFTVMRLRSIRLAMVYLLASFIAVKLGKDENTANNMFSKYTLMLAVAKGEDAKQNNNIVEDNDHYIRAML